MDADLIAIVRELKARSDIHNALVRYCRGVDRCDPELALSAYHPGAWDAHGSTNGPAAEVIQWAIDTHLRMFISTAHYITNEHMVFDGDTARVESCVEGVLRYEQDGKVYDLIGRGRYLDRFENRSGDWRIVHRVVIKDTSRIDLVGAQASLGLGEKMPCGARIPMDPSCSFFASPAPAT
jgi:SnoaL-like domain